jgi:glycine/D-amino acid oxidase-like deaminating enzyme
MAERHDAEGYWLAEAGDSPADPPLEDTVDADVLIVGGGYTGLWTAWHLRRLNPSARIVLLESGRCGHGPSGRNGGFVNGLWFSLPALRQRFGAGRAIAVARAAQASVDDIGEFCREQGIDAWYRRAGYVQTSTAPAWDGAWEQVVQACTELGEPDACQPLTADQVRGRCDSPLFRDGVLYPGGATVQPARLASGLAAAVRASGVQIFEQSRVLGMGRRGKEVMADTNGGRVHAGAAVLACGAALVGMRRLRHRLTLTSSHVVITEPAPDLLAEINWTGGECITDSRAMIHYFRTTPDGRIAFGWGGGKVVYGSRTGGRAEIAPEVVAEVERHLRRFFPGLADRRIEHAWGGPIDISPSHLPVVTEVEPGVWAAFGYTGHGVGPSQMVGRSLASLVTGRDDDHSRLAIVGSPAIRVPPEPLRFLGGSMIRRAILTKETRQEQGRTAGPLTRAVAAIPEKLGIHVSR